MSARFNLFIKQLIRYKILYFLWFSTDISFRCYFDSFARDELLVFKLTVEN